MYRIKEQYKRHLAYYATTKLDIINGVYDKATWNKAGFGDRVLELVNE